MLMRAVVIYCWVRNEVHVRWCEVTLVIVAVMTTADGEVLAFISYGRAHPRYRDVSVAVTSVSQSPSGKNRTKEA